MKYIVCVKQVPDTSGKVAVKDDGTMDPLPAIWGRLTSMLLRRRFR